MIFNNPIRTTALWESFNELISCRALRLLKKRVMQAKCDRLDGLSSLISIKEICREVCGSFNIAFEKEQHKWHELLLFESLRHFDDCLRNNTVLIGGVEYHSFWEVVYRFPLNPDVTSGRLWWGTNKYGPREKRQDILVTFLSKLWRKLPEAIHLNSRWMASDSYKRVVVRRGLAL